MAVCTPSGRGQHGRDGDRNGAGTRGEAATGSNDRTSGSASLPARTARPGRRRRAASPSRRAPADHPPPATRNRDASLFLVAAPHPPFQRQCHRTLWPDSPDTGPFGRHACGDPAGFPASVGPLHAASDGAPVPSNHRCSRSARDRSSCTRRPGSRTARTRTRGQTPERSAHHRRRGVDERRLRQDTRPACVLPGTVWGAAPEQNCQVLFGAVLTLKSGRCPPACRGLRCPGYPPKPPRHHRHRIRSATCRIRAHVPATTPGQAPPPHSGEVRQQ